MSDARVLDLKIQHRLRSAFLTVFASQDGWLVLSAIGNQCGVNETDPANIRPDLVAHWNWFLSMLGIRGEVNLNVISQAGFDQYTQEARALMQIANMNDVTAELAQIGGDDVGRENPGELHNPADR